MKYFLNAWTKDRSLILTGVLLLASCSPAPDVEHKEGGGDDRAIQAAQLPLQPLDQLHALIPNPAINACQLKEIEEEFDERIFSDDQGTVPLPRPKFKVKASSLLTLLKNGNEACGGDLSALLIHYGLDNEGGLTYGLAMICADDDLKFTLPSVFYVPDGNLELIPWVPPAGSTETWISTFGAKYTAHPTGHNVFLRKTPNGNDVDAFSYSTDVRFMVQSEERVRQLIQNNSSSTGPKISEVELVSFAHQHENNGNFFHGVCMVGVNEYGRAIGNGPTTMANPLLLRAVDLGSPCPQNCDVFNAAFAGVDVPGCN